MRYGMVIDLLRCMGCQACVVACRAENGTPPGVLYNRIEQLITGTYPKARPVSAPMACRHCQEPDCVKACPTNATFKRDDGVVVIDEDKCIGCGACLPACPYGARSLVLDLPSYYPGQAATPFEMIAVEGRETGKAAKCDFCSHRLKEGQLPACVETCPALARHFGDLDDPASPPALALKKHEPASAETDTKAGPSVYYIRSEEICG